MISTDLLRVFIAVAENGGFTRAAAELNRTQSAVSMQIKRLEVTLGVSLFERESRSIALSRQGQIFIGYARRILALVDESQGAMNLTTQVRSVRLGCIEDYAARVLPKVLAEFWRENPDAHVEVRTGETVHLLECLGVDYDIVLAMHPDGSREGRFVRQDRLQWVTSISDSPHAGDPLPLALRPDGYLERQWATAALDAAGRQWRCAYVSANIGTLQTAVEAGLAVGVFKASTVTAGMRCLTESDGFPRLPPVRIALHVAGEARSPIAGPLIEKIVASLGDPDRGDPDRGSVRGATKLQ